MDLFIFLGERKKSFKPSVVLALATAKQALSQLQQHTETSPQ